METIRAWDDAAETLDEPTGRYVSFTEREEVALLKAQNKGVREIARAIGRDPGMVS